LFGQPDMVAARGRVSNATARRTDIFVSEVTLQLFDRAETQCAYWRTVILQICYDYG
jgi:hypothetical protein